MVLNNRRTGAQSMLRRQIECPRRSAQNQPGNPQVILTLRADGRTGLHIERVAKRTYWIGLGERSFYVHEPSGNGSSVQLQLVECLGFSELGDAPKYEATIKTDPYGDFSAGRWPWLFQDVRRVEPVSINGRQGVWNLPAAVVTELRSG